MTIRLVYSSATTTQLIAQFLAHATRGVQLDAKIVLQLFALATTTKLTRIIWCARNISREFTLLVSFNAIPPMYLVYQHVHEISIQTFLNVRVGITAPMVAPVITMNVRNQQRPHR